MQFLFQVPGMAFFVCGEVRLMLSRPVGTAAFHPGSILYYRVRYIQSAFESLSARNLGFAGKPFLGARMSDHELWMVFFKDSEGNTPDLMSEVPNESRQGAYRDG